MGWPGPGEAPGGAGLKQVRTSHAPPRPHLGTEAFRRLKDELIRRTGHFYYDDKDEVLRERIEHRIRQAGDGDAAAYLKRLASGPEGDAEWRALEGAITIGETFFFRYAEQFKALRQTIIPALMKARSEERRLRIWSAGSANGAEAYSLSILLHEIMDETIGDWRVSILGTDISPAALRAAREATYGRWALRTLDPERRAQWFDPVGPERWSLKPRFRRLVRFEHGNLMDLVEGTAPLGLSGFDLILCRNVLIYFHPSTSLRLVEALGARLAPHGWLLLGHAEPSPDLNRILTPVQLPGCVAYRRPGAFSPDTPLPSPAALPAPAPPPLEAAAPPQPHRGEPGYEARAPQTALQQATGLSIPPADAPGAPETPGRVDPGVKIAQVRMLADMGAFIAAREAAMEAIEAEPHDPLPYFYLGLVLQALGDAQAAVSPLRKAVYLRPDFLLAQHHLGLALAASGRSDQARRTFTALFHATGTLGPDVRLAEGSGLTVAELRELARIHLEHSVQGDDP